MSLRTTVLACLLPGLVACAAPATRTPPPEATTAPAGAPAAHDQLYALLYMQTALEYEATARSVYQAAMRQLAPVAQQASRTGDFESTGAAEYGTALPEGEALNNDAHQPLAIILDIDETVLDNSPYQARTLLANQGFEDAGWTAWGEERRARPIPGALELLQWARQQGITPFYVSNRRSKMLVATADNLRAMGFFVHDDNSNVLLRDDTRGWGKNKGSRRIWVDRDYRVIALFGDNLGDFLDDVFDDPAARLARSKPYQGWWGTRWFMLPNPSYGSWLDVMALPCLNAKPAVSVRVCLRRFMRTQ